MNGLELYPYQKEAVEAMLGNRSFLLADDMGLGKTVTQLVEVRATTDYRHRILIVCPKSVIDVWVTHVRWLMPEWRAVRIPPQDETQPYVCITNYEQVRINLPWFRKVFWDFLVLDEAHYIKGRSTKRTKAVKHLNARFRRALTGTPVINRPDELWSILNFLEPQRFRSYWKFYEHFVNYWQHPTMGYKKVLGPKNTEELRRLIHPYFLRRLKTEVLQDLPEKYYTTIHVELSPKQRRAYEEMKQEALAWVGKREDEDLPAPVVVAKLTRLRQLTGAYANREYTDGQLTVELSEPSAKLDVLMELLEDTDQSVVVFTMFKQMVYLAEERFKKAKIPYVTLTGDTSSEDRKWAVDLFQKGGARVFIGTIQAGGVGITLHRASTVVFLDRSWSPADNKQAEDRLHRIGQKNAVQVIHLNAKNTVDEQVEKKLEMKRSWILQMLGK